MIQINLLRVSPDSQYIEFSIECPTDYLFNTLNIKKYDWNTTTGYPLNANGWIDASSLYQRTSTKEIMRISTSIFGGSTMFYFEFGVQWVGTGLEPVDPCNGKLSDNTTVGICSDINNTYEYLFSSILNIYDATGCVKVSDDLKKAYTFLYAHQKAMELERIEDAEVFYNILKDNFSICAQSDRQSSVQGCNCN